MSETMRIIYLQAENVKRLKAIRIKPDKTLVRIEGRNAQGKSSVLDAIAAALGGGKWNPELPVRKGEKKASVKLDLGSLKIERRWTATGGTVLEVTTAEGVPQKSPQAILDALVGNLTFDPLEFVRMKPKDQAEILKQLAGITFDDLEQQRESLYTQRTAANRDAKNAEAALGSPPPSNVPAKPVDVSELAKQNAAAITHNAEMDRIAAAVANLNSQAAGIRRQCDSECERLRTLKQRLESDLAAAIEALGTTQERGEIEAAAATTKANAEAAKLSGMTRIDITGFAAEIASAETVNRMIREAEAWKLRKSDLAKKQKLAEELDSKIADIDAEKDRRLMNAKFPLDGLSIDAAGPTLNGIPFSQSSSAEQLRTSVAIGLSEKKQARIMLIRDGSLLDNSGMDALHAIAEEYDAQVFVERVADSATPNAVYIEDGEIVGAAE